MTAAMAVTQRPETVPEPPNATAGRYILAILAAVDGPEGEVRPSTLADRLGVTPASVTEMTERLAAQGLVDHEPYGAIALTADGTAVATNLQWRQCVLRRFFADEMDIEIPEAAAVSAGTALPEAALRRLSDAVDIDCRGRCDDRVWEPERSCLDDGL